MSILDQLSGILSQYSSGSASTASQDQAAGHFQQVANSMPQSQLGGLLGSIFGSSETGSFGQNISQMFGQSNPQQKAGILNHLLPATGGGSVSEEQAAQMSPDSVEQMANQAQQRDPGIVQKAADFYSQHPQLVQALGAGVGFWALRHMNNSGNAS